MPIGLVARRGRDAADAIDRYRSCLPARRPRGVRGRELQRRSRRSPDRHRPQRGGQISLLRLICGLIRIAQGQLALEGGDDELTIGEQAHYLGHLDALKPALSVAENLRFWAALSQATAPATWSSRWRAVGPRCELADLPAGLSFGRAKAAAVDRAPLAVKRPLWLLDEPTSALDVTAQARLTELMQAHLAGGGLILAATHGPLGLENAQELRLGAVQ